MNLKSTIVLVVLALGCGVLFWKGPEWGPKLGLAPQPIATSDSGTAKSLAELPVDQIRKIEIDVPDQPKLVLQAAGAGQPLELPGNWPIRRSEVDNLVNVLHDLKTRYYPIAVDDNTDLKPYGLTDSEKPIAVTITTASGVEKLKFGAAPLQKGENPFTRANFVRMGDKNEILRLGPQVLPVLLRPEDAYRRRQLFPESVRVRVAEPKRQRIPGMDEPDRTPPTTFLLSDTAVRIAVTMPSGRFVLQRVAPNPHPQPPADKPDDDAVIQAAQLAESWIMVEPVRDRIDPDRARAILTAIPNLWLEKFVESPPHSAPLYGLGAEPNLTPQLLTLIGGGFPNGTFTTPWQAAIAVLSAPEAKSPSASLTVTLQDGSERTLQIGRVARTIGSDDLRYAKLDKNPLIFELKGDKLSDLQSNMSKPSPTSPGPSFDDMRDPTLVRFDDAQVTGIDISSKSEPGARPIKLEKLGDEWKLVQPVADLANRAEVSELLALLKGMEARKGSIIDGALKLPLWVIGSAGAIEPKQVLGLAPEPAKTVTLTFSAKSGRKPVTYLIGTRDAATKKRPVMVQDWPRINMVDDPAEANQVSKLDRQPSSYRTLKLFEPTAKINEVIVQRSAEDGHPADGYTILEQEGSPPKWVISAPFKAETDFSSARTLANELGNLGTQKYVYDSSTDSPFKTSSWPAFLTGLGIAAPAGDAIFGLAPPAMTITLKFSEPKGAPDKIIEIGRPRSDTEYFARMKGSTGVFVVPDRVFKAVDHKAVDLVDKSLIQFATKPDVQSLRRSMAGQDLEIGQNNSALWEILKPITAKADQETVNELAEALSNLRASRIESVTPKDLKEYGLEPPVATITVEALEKSKLVEKTLLVGNPVDPANPKGDRFVKAQGSTMVGVVPGVLAEKLIAAPQKFRDLSLGGFVTADKLIIERPDRKVTFVKGPTGWKMKEPVEADAEDTDLRELHDNLAKLRAEELVEDKPKDLAKYGLDKPTHWRFFNGDREVLHLLTGDREKLGKDKKTEGIRVYAMLDKGNAVALLDWRLSHKLTEEYRKRSLWEPFQPMDANEVTLKTANPKESFTFAKGPVGWISPGNLTEQLNSPLVNELLQTLSTLQVDRFVVDKGADPAKYGLDKPRSLSVTMADGKKRAILLGNLLDGKRLYAKLDDPARTDVFLLNASDSAVLNWTRAQYVVMPKEEPKKDAPKKDEPKKDLKKDESKKDLKKDEPKGDVFKKSPDGKTEPKKGGQ